MRTVFLRRIVGLFMAVLMLFSVFACDNEPDVSHSDDTENQIDDIQNDSVGDESELDPLPIEPDEKVEYPTVEESYVQDLYGRLMGNKDTEKIDFYLDSKITLDDVDIYDIYQMVYSAYTEDSYEDDYSYVYYDWEVFKSHAIALFGEAVSFDNSIYWAGDGLGFTFDEENSYFVGDAAYPGGYHYLYVTEFSSYEQENEFLYIYDRILHADTTPESLTNAGYTKLTYIYSNSEKTEILQEFNTYDYWTGVVSVDSIHFENYGIEYKHTFKRAEDGTYYWISSEPVTE